MLLVFLLSTRSYCVRLPCDAGMLLFRFCPSMHFSKLISLVAVLVAVVLATTGVSAQNGLLSTSTSTGQATVVILDATSWANQVDENGYSVMLYPFFMSASQLATRGATAGYVMLQSPSGTVVYINVYNVTTSADISAVTSWLNALPATEDDIQVSFTPSWSGTTLAITPSSWSMYGINLVPFGVNQTTCNLTQAATCMGALLLKATTGGFACATYGVSALRSCFAPPIGTGCLGWLVNELSLLSSYCLTDISIVSSVVCTDGSSGATALCDYVAEMVPSGKVGVTITSADAAGSVSSPPTGAAGIATLGAATAILAAVLAL